VARGETEDEIRGYQKVPETVAPIKKRVRKEGEISSRTKKLGGGCRRTSKPGMGKKTLHVDLPILGQVGVGKEVRQKEN